MSHSRTRRLVALIASATLLASLAATVAGPASAADEVGCQGKVATIVGTQGDDVLDGTEGRDIIAGMGGDDVIRGLGGHDLICGGRGDDRVLGNQGRDRLFGNAGADKLLGGKGPDSLFGGVSDDLLTGDTGNDGFDGGPGTDTCHQDQGTGSKTSCELPAAPVVVPPPVVKPPAPKPDTDGDGVTDDVDACPNQGSQGHGVDATGCPINFQSVCEDLGGTYEAGPVSLPVFGDNSPACTWNGISNVDWNAAITPLDVVKPCPVLQGVWQSSADPDYLGCPVV